MLLGVGFLQQRTPELVAGGRVEHDELISHCWQSVVHNHIEPFVVVPELRDDQRTCYSVTNRGTGEFTVYTDFTQSEDNVWLLKIISLVNLFLFDWNVFFACNTV